MSKPITLKIDVTKIDKSLLYKGEKGTYLNVAVFPNKEGVGKFGDTHYCVQEVSKEEREAGKKGPIIGNAKVPTEDRTHEQAPAPRSSNPAVDPDDDIPF